MDNFFEVGGKVCIVTGGSRGLGFEMARTLGDAGARIVIIARKQAQLEEAEAALRDRGIDVVSIAGDLCDIASLDTLAGAIHERAGPVDVLVNNAGAVWGGPASELEWSRWQKVLDVNLNGTWMLTQAIAVRSMLPRRQGSIIFIASVMGLGGVAPRGTPAVAYSTSKAAQINLMRALAGEWGEVGVRVNAILPGWFPTDMNHHELSENGAMHLDRIPLGRFGEPEADLSGPILFLASEASRYVTGQSLVVDGGISAIV